MVCDGGVGTFVLIGNCCILDPGFGSGGVCRTSGMGGLYIHDFVCIVGIWRYDLAESVGVAEMVGWL